MSKTIFYRQCQVQQNNSFQMLTWIPEKYATSGDTLRLKNALDNWEDGWKVIWMSKTRLAEELLPDYHSDTKQHVKDTGDAKRHH